MVLFHFARLGEATLDAPVRAFLDIAAEIPAIRERLTDDPSRANVILFTQPHMLSTDFRLRTIAEHPLQQRFPERTVVYDERDRPWGAFRGVYTSMPLKHWQQGRFRAWAYYMVPRPVCDQSGDLAAPDLLFSFIGSPTARCREPLFALRHPDALVERVERFLFWDSGSESFAERRQQYHESMMRSRFVLCPRGHGTSSIRLYEVLAAGRVPVIVADDWVAPTGPDWSEFSIRWPEGQTDGLVELLTSRTSEWTGMAQRALDAYERFFAPEVSIGRILDLCAELIGAPVAMPGLWGREPGVRRAALDTGLRTLRASVNAARGRG